jgi:OmpA-OmpF porin, OOP family
MSVSGSDEMRRARHAGSALVVFGLLALARSASGQSRTGFAVGRYEPADRGSAWFVADDLDLRGRARPAVGATLDYAHKPLAVYDTAERERLALVRHQTLVHLGGAIVLEDRLRLGASLPLAVYQDGENARIGGDVLRAATSPAFGDLRLAADVRFVGRYREPLTFAAGLRVWLPTGLRSQFTSDGSARVAPQVLLAGAAGALVWSGRAAIVVRTRDDRYAGTALGSEIAVGVAVGVRLGRLLVGPELFASTAVSGDDVLRADRTPADALLGVHADLPRGLRVGAAIGSGLTRGYGSPAFRGLLSIEWGCSAPELPPDQDHDRIPDAADACIDVPGVPSGDPAEHGCPPEPVPDEDTDRDGVRDRDDACPTVSGLRTPDPMTNGCPAGGPRPLAVATTTEIRIGEEIRFATDSADLVSESDAVLGAVRRLLEEHPAIRRVRVEGHTDAVGDPAYNEDLSRRRASSVVRWLVDHGVAGDRLESTGWGSARPLAPNDTEEGRARNRRVVFTIVEQGPARNPRK